MQVAFERREQCKDPGDRLDAQELVLQGRHQALLAARTPEIGAILRRITRTCVDERPCAVHMLGPRLEAYSHNTGIDLRVVIRRVVAIGESALDLHVDAAKRIDELAKAREVETDPVVDRQPKHLRYNLGG